MRRAMPGIAILAAGLMLLAGCTADGTSSGGSAPSTNGIGPITFAIGKDNSGWLQGIIAGWNQGHPGQRVTLLLLPQASNGQLDPNISTQYDFRELLTNRNGPLPNDRPHNIKLQGSYFIPFGGNSIVLGLAFNANSGAPIEVLGASPQIGESEVFVLPRGSGGRTPWVTQLDLHLSYKRKLSSLFSVEAYWDVFNVLNQQAVTSVDEEYTFSQVSPVQNGRVADLANLKTIGGQPVQVNPNYGSATAFQQPLSMRFGTTKLPTKPMAYRNAARKTTYATMPYRTARNLPMCPSQG